MVRADTTHLRVQLTLLAAGPAAARRGHFRSKLRTGSRHFDCEIYPDEAIVPGGHAVHSSVVFDDPHDALAALPPGSMFELWEGGRRGYGMVLGAGNR
jgi:hypothetical protein